MDQHYDEPSSSVTWTRKRQHNLLRRSRPDSTSNVIEGGGGKRGIKASLLSQFKMQGLVDTKSGTYAKWGPEERHSRIQTLS